MVAFVTRPAAAVRVPEAGLTLAADPATDAFHVALTGVVPAALLSWMVSVVLLPGAIVTAG